MGGGGGGCRQRGAGGRRRRGGGGHKKKGGGAGGNSLQNLHAMVVGVNNDDAPVAVDGDAALRVAKFAGA